MSRLRELSRSLRGLPVVGGLIERTDPPRRMARLLAAGIMDPVLYAAQMGVEEISTAEAIRHYVYFGFRHGFAVNALVDNFVLKDHLPGTARPLVYDYLAAGDWRVPVSPFWDVRDYLADHPESAEHPGGPVGHLWARVTSDPAIPVRIRDAVGSREVPWSTLYAELLEAMADWARARASRRLRRPNSWMEKPDTILPRLGTGAPLTSIVMAVWNRAEGMRTAVESVLAQTSPHWELVIVDDGSWDDSVAVARVLAGRDDRIRVVERDHEGVSAARNAGIAEARGAYLAFLDSDNTWQPDFLEKMIATMEAEDDGAAFATIKLVYEDRVGYRQREPTADSLALGNSIDLNTLVIRRDVLNRIGGFDPALPRAVDYDLILRLAAAVPIRHVPVLGAVYDNRDEAEDRISTTVPVGWNIAVRLRAQMPWTELEGRTLATGTTVLAVMFRRDPQLTHKLRELIALSEDPDTTVVAAFVAPTREEWTAGAMARLGRPRLRTHLFVEREPLSYAVTAALTDVDREGLVVLGPTTVFDADGVRRMGARLHASPGTALTPVETTPEGELVGVGAGVPAPGVAPVPLLAGHPVADAVAAGGREAAVEVPAMHGSTFAVRTADLVAVRGLDPLTYNERELPVLSARLRGLDPEYRFEVVTDVVWRSIPNAGRRIMDARGSASAAAAACRDLGDGADVYARIGQRLAHWRAVPTESGTPELAPVVVREPARTQEGTPRLRWALKIAAPFGPVGEVWGDTHFARSLARALERLGQEVVIDHHHAHERESGHLDDVTLVIRGLDEVVPVTAGVSLLWVISHPELVGRREAAAFDRVFAASERWAREQGRRWELPVQPLLQCTDARLFAPTGRERSGDLVFVGNSRHVSRPAVLEPVRAGVPVRVYGGDWEKFIPSELVVAPRVDNAEVGALYEAAGAVLNDHWRDMQRDGFISNRLFDVVAAGGRAISDDVEGIAELFGGAVATFSSPSRLADMVRGDLDALFPADDELRAVSERIRTDHSFDARARVLLDAALALRRR